MLAESVLRELGGFRRKFVSVRAAVMFYRNELSRRLSASRGLSFGSIPISAEHRTEREATFAAVAQCLKGGLDVTPDGRWRAQKAWGNGEAVAWLILWYENTEDDGTELAVESGLRTRHRRNPNAQWLADRSGIERRAFNRRCRGIARRLREKLLAARLLFDSDGR